MVNKAKPEVSIELGGKKRHLRLDLNAMAEFEEVTGENIFKSIDVDKMGARELRALLWAMLLHENKDLTLEEVGSWITTQNMARISQQISEAIDAAIPDKEEVTDKAPLHKKPQPG